MESQCELILRALREARGKLVSMYDLFRVSGSLNVHSRIDELRRAGHHIPPAHKVRKGHKCHSYYRLVEDTQ